MTREELQRFLDRAGTDRVMDYLGVDAREAALDALEERMRWAAWHFRDDERGWEALFLLNHGHALRELIDEGEDAWWDRTATSSRPHRPARGGPGDWTARKEFMTPPIAPLREEQPWDPGGTTLDAPLDFGRRDLRRGRYLANEPPPGQTLLPEAEDTPEPYTRRRPVTPTDGFSAGRTILPDFTEEDTPDEFVGPGRADVDIDEHTDPIGFTATPLPVAARAHTPDAPARDAPGDAVTFAWHEVDADEVTDPSGPKPILEPMPEPVPPPVPPRSRHWLGWIALVLGMVALGAGGTGLALALSQLGHQQGEALALGNRTTRSSVSVEQPPPPRADHLGEPVPEAAVQPAPAAAPRPAPVAAAPAGTTDEAPQARTPPSLAGTRWVGTGGTGELTLRITRHDGPIVEGQLIQVVGGLDQPEPVRGQLDPSGMLTLETDGGLVLTGTIEGSTARGTWNPDGTSRQWLLARQ